MKAILKCKFCLKEFSVIPYRAKMGQKFCSISCGLKANPRVKNKGNANVLLEYKKTHPVWNKGQKYEAISGVKHWNWQGGKTKESLAARTSLEYKLWRKAVYERDEYRCVMCGYKGNQLIADHIKSFSRYPELRFSIENGRALCRECHKTTPNYCGKVRVNIYA